MASAIGKLAKSLLHKLQMRHKGPSIVGPGRLSYRKSKTTSCGWRAKPIQVLPGGKNLDTAIGFHTEKVIIAGDGDDL